jgi:hypothetical protein
MFYPVEIPKPDPSKKQIAALAVLSPAQSRRLVAKGAVACPLVQKAYRDGMIIITRGITNAYVMEEMLGVSIANKANQTLGVVAGGVLNAATTPPPCTLHVIRRGKVVEGADSNVEILAMKKGDVVIKGANAIDATGLTGTYASSLKSGTIGATWPFVTARGGEFIIPVSLEKLVPSVMEAAAHSGVYHYQLSTGLPVKVIPLVEARAITEIQALGILCGVRAFQTGAGGVAGSEGSVHLAVEGDEDRVRQAFELLESLKGEPPVGMPDTTALKDPGEYQFLAQPQLDALGGR